MSAPTAAVAASEKVQLLQHLNRDLLLPTSAAVHDSEAQRQARRPLLSRVSMIALLAFLSLFSLLARFSPSLPCPHRIFRHGHGHGHPSPPSPYGSFPDPSDPFHFLPCTNVTLPPALDDNHPLKSWSTLFDPNPHHWSWGNQSSTASFKHDDPYAGRGIYLCGYLDVPLDYTNKSDTRIARLAVTKYQVSGLAPVHSKSSERHGAGKKSPRTIVVNPGGPGGSGTSMAWRSAETFSARFSDGKFDLLGWDPRGVNASLPAISCYPFDADRDRWSQFTNQYLETAFTSPRAHLELSDSMWEATMRACHERHGDLARFLSTAFVARDVEQIRRALGEDELTAVMISYGTGIGQTYANMFPDSVGRMILDGTEYVRDHRLLGGFGFTALDNVTDAWHDGFLGECVNAGPDHCALARAQQGSSVTVDALQSRMADLFQSVLRRPVPGYTEHSGPSLLTYSDLIGMIYSALYNAKSWPSLAEMLYELERGNSTLAIQMADREWQYDPKSTIVPKHPSTDELTLLVICSDSYDAPQPDGLEWWQDLWTNMTTKSFIAGNSRFFDVLPCRHFNTHWPKPAEVYRGDLNNTLHLPILLIAETYDPATPLRNGRRLLHEMGDNARLIVHHGYGHSSRDTSACTERIAKAYISNGTLPQDAETDCYADEKPYLYDVKKPAIKLWQEHVEEMALMRPRL